MEKTGQQTVRGNGAMGIRTPDLLNAIEALYQLSYDPEAKENKNTGGVGWQCHSLMGREFPPLPSSEFHFRLKVKSSVGRNNRPTCKSSAMDDLEAENDGRPKNKLSPLE